MWASLEVGAKRIIQLKQVRSSYSSSVFHHWSWKVRGVIKPMFWCKKQHISHCVLTFTTRPWIIYCDRKSCWQLLYPIPNPRPDPNDTGHVRPGGRRDREIKSHLLVFTDIYREIKLTFKEEDGKHDADTDARHCKEKKRNIKKLIKQKRQNHEIRLL